MKNDTHTMAKHTHAQLRTHTHIVKPCDSDDGNAHTPGMYASSASSYSLIARLMASLSRWLRATYIHTHHSMYVFVILMHANCVLCAIAGRVLNSLIVTLVARRL